MQNMSRTILLIQKNLDLLLDELHGTGVEKPELTADLKKKLMRYGMKGGSATNFSLEV